MLLQVVPPDHDPAARGTDDPRDAAERGGLAGAVGADQPEHLARGDVERQLGVSRAAATTFIQRLEAKGLVETTPDSDDDRGVRVTLTRRGLEALLKAGQLERRLAARTIEGLPASSITRAVALLQELKRRLEGRQIAGVP